MNGLTLNPEARLLDNEMISDTFSAHSSSSRIKKRRYRELDSCWSIDDTRKGDDLIRATHN